MGTLHEETIRILVERFGYSPRVANDITNIPENWRVTEAMKANGQLAKAQALANLENFRNWLSPAETETAFLALAKEDWS